MEGAVVTGGEAAQLEDLLVRDRERQTKALALALGESLDGRVAIYLDTRYWLILRDVRRGGYGASGAELLERLRAGVRAGRVFCRSARA